MLDAVRTFLTDFGRTVRLADLLDIALAAVFFYVVITWLRRSLSRGTLLVVAGFAAVFLLARLLELYLIEMIIRALAVVFLLAAVVMFQSDLRRLIDRMSTLGSKGRRAIHLETSPVVDLLVEAAARMADTRTGALLAVRGRELWERHIEGGVEMDGKVSLPLLYSLFDPATPGHDGAVLVEGESITKFGAHLSLSSNLDEVGRHGTRHAAALGLAEECDAFVIVVSEERGTISVAQDGQLTRMASASELKQRLTLFWERHYVDSESSGRTWPTRRTMQTALLALLLASLSWFALAYQPGNVFRTMQLPIELRNLPAQWALGDPDPSEVRVTLAGPEQAFRLLDPSSLVVSLDLADVQEGENTFEVDEDNLRLPSGVDLYRAEPQVVRIDAHPTRTVEVPVEVRIRGSLPDSLELVSLRPSPSRVRILVPSTDFNPPTRIRTEPIDLNTITSGADPVRTRMALPDRVRLPQGQRAEVTVSVRMRAKPSAER